MKFDRVKILIGTCFCILCGLLTFGQTHEIDSLRKIVDNDKTDRTTGLDALIKLTNSLEERDDTNPYEGFGERALYFLSKPSESTKIDTTSVIILYYLGGVYQFRNLDSAILMSTQALEAAISLGYRRGEANASRALGENYRLHGNYIKALESLFRALSISREIHDRETETESLYFIGIAYLGLGEYRTALNFIFQGMSLIDHYSFKPTFPFLLSNIGTAYEKLDMLDSARYFQEKARQVTDTMTLNMPPLNAQVLASLGKVYDRMGNSQLAKRYYHESIQIQDYLNLGVAQYLLANLFYNLRESDSSLYYARLGFISCKKALENAQVVDVSRLLVKIFTDRQMTDSAFHYQSIAMAITDSLYSPQKFNQLQLLAVREQQRQFETIAKQKEVEQEKKNLANRTKVYGLLAALAVFLLIASILFRNNRQKQKANALLEQQKTEISRALSDLKNTQAQLIQSEKMASLGELTAGIAHEIQNPLNFVNNFSDLNRELLSDMRAQIAQGNYSAASGMAVDIESNEEKINHHGKRAESIVKGMLQHSRGGTGQKALTDVNALVEEYLRLSYHGLKAKEKGFDAVIETDFGPIQNLFLVREDVGRVILNILNNAFYVLKERKKEGAGNYTPTVSVTTGKSPNGNIQISIRDNGNGIPSGIKDKIFQPFFTTKPTGQGTGLGLSLSYDIVKAMGGEIRVDSKIGEGTVFAILLPANG